MPLTPKQRRFVAEYLIDSNATQAAIRAGYARASARQIGHENLSKPDIAAAIAEGQRRLAGGAELRAERVLRELAGIAFASAADYLSVDDTGQPVLDLRRCTPEQLRALSEVTVHEVVTQGGVRRRGKVKLDKMQALLRLADHFGIGTKNAESGPGDHLAALLKRLFETADRMEPGVPLGVPED